MLKSGARHKKKKLVWGGGGLMDRIYINWEKKESHILNEGIWVEGHTYIEEGVQGI